MKLLTILSAALGRDIYGRYAKAPFWKNLHVTELDSFFPALTCPAQAAFRTGADVSVHGMGASGFFSRELRKAFFWEQSSALYSGDRIWKDFRAKGGKVAQICVQQCPGMDSDWYLSPAPIHKHHGGMIQDFFSAPPDLYQSVCHDIRQKFNLMNYWGPMTNVKASTWIAKATANVLRRMASENDTYVLTYIPHLDYASQRNGPESDETEEAFAEYEECLQILLDAAKKYGYEVQILGDYAITQAENAVFPNRLLAEKGYLSLRNVKGMLYPNLHSSHAFALVDHQICHVYVNDPEDIAPICAIFEALPGVSCAIRRDNSPELDHPRCGEVILVAEEGSWFAYHWWDEDDQAPDYATHVDIHNKPGFDPMELFGAIWPPMSTPLDTSLLQGTHGRPGQIIHASTFTPDEDMHTFTGASLAVKDMLSR